MLGTKKEMCELPTGNIVVEVLNKSQKSDFYLLSALYSTHSQESVFQKSDETITTVYILKPGNMIVY